MLKQIWDNDVAAKMMLTAFVGQCLQQAEAICGADALQSRYLSRTDPAVLSELMNEITGNGPGNRKY